MAAHATREAFFESYPAVLLVSERAELEAAFVPSLGMIGCSLRHRGDELLGQRGGLARYEATGSTMGIPLLHPWANRLAGPRYEAAGKTVELASDAAGLRLDPNGCPIHGVVGASPHWSEPKHDADEDSARLTARLDYGAHEDLLESFPFPHELRMDIALTEERLTIATTLTPTADTPVPVSFGYHPYLQLPDVPRADWHVELPVGEHILVDERGIPTGETERVDLPPGPLGDRTFDDGYGDLADPPIFALAGGGRRVEVAFEESYPIAQVYAPEGEDVICFEPMTAPTNALASGGERLPIAEPGAPFEARFSIAVRAS